MLWAAHHANNGLESTFGLFITAVSLIFGIIYWIAVSTSPHQPVNRNGRPYCANCGKQVSLKRGHCRSCGYSFLFGDPSGTQESPPTPYVESPIDKAFEASFKWIGNAICFVPWLLYQVTCWSILTAWKIVRLRWIKDLPEWAQPVAWGIAIALPPCVIFVAIRAVLVLTAKPPS